MTYEYNPYTLAMYSDQNSVTENSEDRDNKEEEDNEDETKERDLTNNDVDQRENVEHFKKSNHLSNIETELRKNTIDYKISYMKPKRIPRLESKVRNLLQLVFNDYRYPTLELKKRLSNETGLRIEVVNMWMSKR